MKSLCVYCGASIGALPVYSEAARQLAATLVSRDIALVYGGGRVGLMGVIADEVMRLGGEATGIIPQALMDREVGHAGLTRLHVVRDMHERKAMMADLSDGFIAMPGGIGTLEELFEVFTWAQLGLHSKPIGLLNCNGFYDQLIGFIKHLVNQQFLKPEQAKLLIQEADPDVLVDAMRHFTVPAHSPAFNQEQARKLI